MNRYTVMTLFPEMIDSLGSVSILGRAAERGLISIEAVDIRVYTNNKHGRVDDYTYGGGAGMLMQAAPVYECYRAITADGSSPRVIYVTPQGELFNQAKAKELAKEEHLIFLCGHYEGIDERVLERIVTDQISIGDYVLTGGELPCMVMIDSIARNIPGVLHNTDSADYDSFSDGLLEYPQYTRPEEWMGMKVPEVLLSGDHKKVEEWRHSQSLDRTRVRRPDLYEAYMRLHDSK